MNILDTLRLMARSYPGGVEALAQRLFKQPGTLDKELRGARGFKLGACDAAEMSAMCIELQTEHALAYVTTVAVGSNCMLVPLPDAGDLPAGDCMRALADTSRQAADLIAEVCASLADHKVSDNELARVDRASGQVIAAMQTLRRVMAALNRAGKPPGVE
jgi:hypothetical protein